MRAWALAIGFLALAACGPQEHRVAGNYRSTWGAAVVAQSKGEVAIAYPRGSMHCDATGDVLDCRWKSEEATGRAKLVRNADRTITGTWGHGDSATDGGAWAFAPAPE